MLPAMVKVNVPTLVIWGEQDGALLTGNLEGLDAHVPQLTVRRIPEGTHWVIHEKPARKGESLHPRVHRQVTHRQEIACA